MIACYTAVANEYDKLAVHPEVEGVDFIAFTDDDRSARAAGWDARELPTPPGVLSHRMRAKEVKLLPHRYLADYDWTFWVDASHIIKTANFFDEALTWARKTGFALHRHPHRDCIYDEAEASLTLWKYAGENITEQIEVYRKGGHPEHWGLWACGSMLRANGNWELDELFEDWWYHCIEWSAQDQLSLPYLLRQHKIMPTDFPHHQLNGNPWFGIKAHPRNDE